MPAHELSRLATEAIPDPIKAAMAHALGTHIDLFQRIVISTCSISAVGFTTDGPIALTVNSTGGSLTDLTPS